MAFRKRVLMIDDKRDSFRLLEILPADEFKTYRAESAEEGIEKVRKLRPDVTLVDYHLPLLSGDKVCQALRRDPRTCDLPIVILTHSTEVKHYNTALPWADDYIEKSEPIDKILAKIRWRARNFVPYPDIKGHQTLTIRLVAGERILYRANGEATILPRCGEIREPHLHAALGELAQYRSQKLYPHEHASNSNGWKETAKFTGWDVFERLFRACPDLLAKFEVLRKHVSKPRLLHLKFECRSLQLRSPLEFMTDRPPDERGEFLALQHPMVRSVIDQQAGGRDGISRGWLNELRKKYSDGDSNSILKVLLIASNTVPDICFVDAEIQFLAEGLQGWFEDRGVPTLVDVLTTSTATLSNVRAALADCRYDIVHYAGHGSFDSSRPDDSALYFWSEPNRKGEISPLTTHSLRLLLEGSSIRLLYLNCCQGAEYAGPHRQGDHDFLGLMDAAHSAFVPAVLGFRWPVSEEGSRLLATRFYQALAEVGELDSALLEARKTVWDEIPEDPAWLSAVLIAGS